MSDSSAEGVGAAPKVERQAWERKLREALAVAGPGLLTTVAAAVALLALVAFFRAELYVVFPAAIYLPLHTIAEVLAVVVGFAIFAVHWHAAVAQRLRQPRALFLGAAFLAIALIDTLHILAFPGMPGLVHPGTTDRGIYYWLAARLLAAVALLAAAFITTETRHPLLRRFPLLALSLALVVALLLVDAAVPHPEWFFVEGRGLTPLKIALEYVVIGLSIVAAVFYWRLWEKTGERAFLVIIAALAMTVLSELMFTLYSVAYDTFNLLGHVYKVIAYYLVFDALFVGALLRPYAQLDATTKDLAASNQELTALRNHIEGELKRTIVRLEESTMAERRAREGAEALAHLARDVATQVELTELLDTLVSRVRVIFDADFAAVATVDMDTGETVWRVGAGYRTDAFRNTVFTPGQGVAGQAIAQRRPVVLERSDDDPAFPPAEYPILAAEGARAVLSVPVGVGEVPFGAFVIAYRREHAFTPEEISLAVGAADHAAVAIRNAELYEAIKRHVGELDAVIGSIADGVVVYSRSGDILRVNRAAREMLGYEEPDLAKPLAQRLSVLNLADSQGRPLQPEETPVAHALRGETLRGQEVLLQRPDGRTYHLIVSAAPVADAEGQALLGAVATLHDITELVELERRREEFLRIVAHDLRQPLTIIQGQAQLMRHALAAGSRERAESSAAAILTGARRMNAIIRDLVDTARLEAGQLELNRQPVDLAGFVADLLDRMAGVTDAGRVRVENVDSLTLANADPDRLERILANLLSNALKYSEAGTIVLVRIARHDGQAVVSVADRGPGIAPDDLPRIFERFYRVSGQRKKKESLGLGLYITRMLVEAHGGRIWAESVMGEGSTFTFTLPLAPDEGA